MQNTTRWLLPSLLSAAFASTVLAVPAAQAANADGLYVGVGAGASSLRNSDGEVGDFIESSGDDFHLDDDDNVYKAFVGYEYNRFFATEAFYSDLGRVDLKSDSGNGDIDSRAFGLSLVGKLPVMPWLDLFAKAGMARWDTDASGQLQGSTLHDDHGIDPVYGLGAQLDLAPVLVRAEYERYDFDSDYQVDAVTASVGWQF
ncbi:outer membrane beta-barrel protein [Salinicola aestuarinus]|uniref:outer membrane beta-barrel protein n=1 Tax=Salinicola aestuarinus TaxID=1949082 RepID=UPI000DA14808|nr:outer membrane beta-barrel protein [Salinicola aestuarinus]